MNTPHIKVLIIYLKYLFTAIIHYEIQNYKYLMNFLL